MSLSEDVKKQVIVVVAMVYEWSFVKWVDDPSKRGFVLEKMKDGTLFDSLPQIMDELKSLLEHDELKEEESMLLAKVILSYH